MASQQAIYTNQQGTLLKLFFPLRELDQVIENEEHFKAENFEVKMSLSLKASRTVFITNFDQSLLQTYSKYDIIEILKQQKWRVKDFYIMKSKKSFKIEMIMTTLKTSNGFFKGRNHKYRRYKNIR